MDYFWGSLRSKTIWVNLLSLIAAIVTLLIGEEWVRENPRLVSILGTVLTVTNIVLRFVTTESLPDKVP